MAQAKKQRRRTKHRGNAVGMVESRGRTGRKGSADEKDVSSRDKARLRREEHQRRPPTWRSAINRAVISALALFAVLLLAFGRGPAEALGLAAVAVIVYVPIGYVTDSFIYKRRIERDARRTQGESS